MGLMNFLTRSATKMAAVTLSKKYTDVVIVMEVGYNVCQQLASQLGNKLAEEVMVRMQKEAMDTDGELTGYECALIKLAWIFRHDNLQPPQREAAFDALRCVSKAATGCVRKRISLYVAEKVGPRLLELIAT